MHAERHLMRTCCLIRQTSVCTKVGPTLVSRIDVLEFQSSLLKVPCERAARPLRRQLSQHLHALGPARWHCILDAFEYDLRRDVI